MKRLLLVAFFTTVAFADQISYREHLVYKITPFSEEHINVLDEVISNQTKLQFATKTIEVGFEVPVIVTRSSQNDFEDKLTQEGLKWELATAKVKRNVDGQRINKYIKYSISSFTWDGYYGLQDIYTFFHDLTKKYNDVVTPVIIGKSVEGRNIEGIKISYGSAKNKRIIFFECGIHPREWIGPAFCTYVAKEILTSKNNQTRAYAEEFEWIIIPVANPDGYSWSFSKNRLWRKNRSPTNLPGVYGVDLNRNFNDHWSTVGASNDPRSLIYAGPSANSEPEIKSYVQYMDSITDKMDVHLAFHSYGQNLLTPFGFTIDKPNNYDDLKAIGDKAAAVLALRYGTEYVVGTIADLASNDSGSTQDFVKFKYNTSLVYCYEMRSINYEEGLLLPADEILPNNLEVWDSILVMITEAKELGYLKRNA